MHLHHVLRASGRTATPLVRQPGGMAGRDSPRAANCGQPINIVRVPDHSPPPITGPERDCERLKTMLRRREAREEGGQVGRTGAGEHQYKMREKLVSIGDDFWIEDNAGNRAFKVDGKALRVRNTLVIQNAEGPGPLQDPGEDAPIKDTMGIRRAPAARQRRSRSPDNCRRDRWTVELPGGEDWRIQGDHPGTTTYPDRERSGEDRRGILQEVVPGAGHLRSGDRPGAGRRAHPGDHRQRSIDGELIATGFGHDRGSLVAG